MSRALAVLGRESPIHARMFAESLADLGLRFEVDEETVRLESDGYAISVSGSLAHADVRVGVSLELALALVRGDTSVVDAIRRGSLDAFGRVQNLDRAARAMEIFVHGLVRCPNGNEVVEELKLAIRERKGRQRG